ncbi:MAG: hypothetical protein JJT93_04005 [Gammaproteobacteria bacterium]|nr:hypothetical protein [Gammaproteobacteria bacterium]
MTPSSHPEAPCTRAPGRLPWGALAPALLLALLLVLSGCASPARVAVEAQFPTPLVEPLPLRAAVYYEAALREFAHSETIPQHSQWEFELGQASIGFFQPLFGALFQQVQTLERLPELGEVGQIDLIVAPRLERFEFDIPRHRDSKFAEVWMQYRLYIYAPDGTPIAEWPVTGYGKSAASGTLPRAALHDAAVRAMREAGATISVKFASQPDVRSWLQENSHVHSVQNGDG